MISFCFDFKLFYAALNFYNRYHYEHTVYVSYFCRSEYKWNNSKGMPAHVFYGNSYDALIASRKLDETLMNFDVQECNMENQFKLVNNLYILLGRNLINLKHFIGEQWRWSSVYSTRRVHHEFFNWTND